ncbi:MAG: preprotein translocase subunit YajC [bacterium]|nr:preprotein translocase subunit YajC [candidate division KSB1 bacterium]MDH7559555.1 preprotein translocase subunit YajC [bacterium]
MTAFLPALMLSASGSAGTKPAMGMFLWIFLLILIMYFFFIRPQAKRQKEVRQMLASIQKGDRVLTVGGIYGVVVGEKEQENIVILKIAENVKVEVAKDRIVHKA